MDMKISQPATDLLADVQASADPRAIAITQVGVRAVRHPLQIAMKDGSVQATIAMFNLYVGLPPSQKGTHMSRFIALLEKHKQAWSLQTFRDILDEMLGLLEASTGYIEASFPLFLKKKAPISGVESLLDYEIKWIVQKNTQQIIQRVVVQVPVTSLCPCSKKISAYGAHNQRSHVTANLTLNKIDSFDLADLIARIEQQASCELYGLLKRPDEKYVTERAYDNPKFVEDLVRDIAIQVRGLDGVASFIVEAENFESIHNHSAYALIDSTQM